MKWMFVLVVFMWLSSCKKDTAKSAFVGKWKLVEMFSLGACNCWVPVASVNADTLEFSILGKYKIKNPAISFSIPCPGRYSLVDDSTIFLRADCGGAGSWLISRGVYSQSTKQLTVEYNLTGAVQRPYRYIKL